MGSLIKRTKLSKRIINAVTSYDNVAVNQRTGARFGVIRVQDPATPIADIPIDVESNRELWMDRDVDVQNDDIRVIEDDNWLVHGVRDHYSGYKQVNAERRTYEGQPPREAVSPTQNVVIPRL